MDSLNEIKSQNFQVDQRAVPDRLNTLKSRYASRMKYEETASGISVAERTPFEQALESVLAKEKVWSKQHDMESEEKGEKAEKAEADRLTVKDMRLKSLETFAETKNKETKNKESRMTKRLDKKARSSGTETLVYLHEKSERFSD